MRIDPAMRIDQTPPKTTPDGAAVERAESRRGTDPQAETPEKADAEWSKDELETAIEQANRALQSFNRRFDYTVHEATKVIMVRVIDSETEELVREVPPEQILNLIAGLRELAGVVVDEHR